MLFRGVKMKKGRMAEELVWLGTEENVNIK
jgi:hypothetical protein